MSERVRTLAGLDLVGGNVGLDFANTINSRTAPEHDYIDTYEDLVAWAERVEILTADAVQALVERATIDRRAAERVLFQSHRLRDAVYRTFSAIATAEPPLATDLRWILRAFGDAVARGSLAIEPGGAKLRWSVGSTLFGVLDPIAYAAGDLLLASNRPPVKECPGCGWLFIDRSRNGRRRWCDMQTCGSRDKMRRFYRSRQSSLGGGVEAAAEPRQAVADLPIGDSPVADDKA
jgi:predicted RNA-binding Zn ribbon-like protein